MACSQENYGQECPSAFRAKSSNCTAVRLGYFRSPFPIVSRQYAMNTVLCLPLSNHRMLQLWFLPCSFPDCIKVEGKHCALPCSAKSSNGTAVRLGSFRVPFPHCINSVVDEHCAMRKLIFLSSRLPPTLYCTRCGFWN
jgi:hypothetical protein